MSVMAATVDEVAVSSDVDRPELSSALVVKPELAVTAQPPQLMALSSFTTTLPRKIGSMALVLTVTLFELSVDVVSHWKKQMASKIFSRSERQTLLDDLAVANTAEQWQVIADRLDQLEGNDIWRQNPESKSYDYKLIASRFRLLVTARKGDKRDQVADLVRSGSLRNLGSIGSPSLYNHAFGGTKFLIEDYVVEIIQGLDYLAQSPLDRELTHTEKQRRLDFFHDTRQSYGRTALVLHGGALFGLCHLGIVKSLLESGLLPSVLIGVTVGAAVAALVCSVPQERLASTLEHLSEDLPPIDQHYAGEYFGGVAESVLRTLYPPEILLFVQYMFEFLGDMTFEEAYLISGRVLNITILPVEREMMSTKSKWLGARLCNYLTTPKVLIRTAILASIGTNAMPTHSGPIEILVKDYKGEVVLAKDYPSEFQPANTLTYFNNRDSPYNRVAELFNVNNFLVSITRPYLAPMLLSDFKYRGRQLLLHNIIRVGRTILLYRLGQLSDLGLLPKILQRTFIDETIPGGFQVNMVPEPESLLRDFALVVDTHNIKEKVDHWIRIGERSVWPMSAIIWTRTAIEFALDSIYEDLITA